MTRTASYVLSTIAGVVLVGAAADQPAHAGSGSKQGQHQGPVTNVRIKQGDTFVVPDPNTTYVITIEGTGQAQAQADAQAQAMTEAECEAKIQAEREAAQVPEGEVITLQGTVLFRDDEATLLPEARANLDAAAVALERMGPESKLVIVGHTDARGTEAHNRQLSEQRANAVRDYLVQRGVSGDRIQTMAKGEDDPVAPNDTAEGRANNRRAELTVEPLMGAG